VTSNIFPTGSNRPFNITFQRKATAADWKQDDGRLQRTLDAIAFDKALRRLGMAPWKNSQGREANKALMLRWEKRGDKAQTTEEVMQKGAITPEV